MRQLLDLDLQGPHRGISRFVHACIGQGTGLQKSFRIDQDAPVAFSPLYGKGLC